MDKISKSGQSFLGKRGPCGVWRLSANRERSRHILNPSCCLRSTCSILGEDFSSSGPSHIHGFCGHLRALWSLPGRAPPAKIESDILSSPTRLSRFDLWQCSMLIVHELKIGEQAWIGDAGYQAGILRPAIGCSREARCHPRRVRSI
jgi:hypothetical protein